MGWEFYCPEQLRVAPSIWGRAQRGRSASSVYFSSLSSLFFFFSSLPLFTFSKKSLRRKNHFVFRNVCLCCLRRLCCLFRGGLGHPLERFRHAPGRGAGGDVLFAATLLVSLELRFRPRGLWHIPSIIHTSPHSCLVSSVSGVVRVWCRPCLVSSMSGVVHVCSHPCLLSSMSAVVHVCSHSMRVDMKGPP